MSHHFCIPISKKDAMRLIQEGNLIGASNSYDRIEEETSEYNLNFFSKYENYFLVLENFVQVDVVSLTRKAQISAFITTCILILIFYGFFFMFIREKTISNLVIATIQLILFFMGIHFFNKTKEYQKQAIEEYNNILHLFKLK